MSRPRIRLPYQISQYLQSVMLRALCRLLVWSGPTAASNAGGYIASRIGPWLPVSRVAHRNLRRILPALDVRQRNVIIRAVWDNLGRTTAELPLLAGLKRTAAGPGWEVQGEQHLAGLKDGFGQALFFSGHFGNWEMVLPIATQLGVPVAGFYRPSSNPWINRLIQRLRLRAQGPGVSMYAKGSHGARDAILHLQRGGSIGLLTDQKMNDGISVPFMGEDAMTPSALAQLACRFDIPVIPVRVVRLGPARFRLVCEAAVSVTRTGHRRTDVYALTSAMNRVLGDWVRADPAAWLWLHRRWPKPPAMA